MYIEREETRTKGYFERSLYIFLQYWDLDYWSWSDSSIRLYAFVTLTNDEFGQRRWLSHPRLRAMYGINWYISVAEQIGKETQCEFRLFQRYAESSLEEGEGSFHWILICFGVVVIVVVVVVIVVVVVVVFNRGFLWPLRRRDWPWKWWDSPNPLTSEK